MVSSFHGCSKVAAATAASVAAATRRRRPLAPVAAMAAPGGAVGLVFSIRLVSTNRVKAKVDIGRLIDTNKSISNEHDTVVNEWNRVVILGETKDDVAKIPNVTN